jgi:hypothetical protein
LLFVKYFPASAGNRTASHFCFTVAAFAIVTFGTWAHFTAPASAQTRTHVPDVVAADRVEVPTVSISNDSNGNRSDSNRDPIADLPPAPESKTSAPTAEQTPIQSQQSTSDEQAPAPGVSSDRVQALPGIPSPNLKVPLTAQKQSTFIPGAIATTENLAVIARRKGLALPLPQAYIVIDKSQRRLDLMSGSTLVKSYAVALGKNPRGAKSAQGDGRTPEGHFYLCTRNATSSAFHIFLGLSYPALPDAKRAVNNKQISWREYQVINQRLASRGTPPWETSLGGWVGIHGGTDGSFAQKKMRERGSGDWTAGCIGLTNAQIEEIYAATRLGTPVDIVP